MLKLGTLGEQKKEKGNSGYWKAELTGFAAGKCEGREREHDVSLGPENLSMNKAAAMARQRRMHWKWAGIETSFVLNMFECEKLKALRGQLECEPEACR